MTLAPPDVPLLEARFPEVSTVVIAYTNIKLLGAVHEMLACPPENPAVTLDGAAVAVVSPDVGVSTNDSAAVVPNRVLFLYIL